MHHVFEFCVGLNSSVDLLVSLMSCLAFCPSINFQCLYQLTAVNDKMAEYTNTPGTASLNAALMHTLQRHRDILQVCPLVHCNVSLLVFLVIYFLYLNEFDIRLSLQKHL